MVTSLDNISRLIKELKKYYPDTYEQKVCDIIKEIENRLRREMKQTGWRSIAGEYLSLREYQKYAMAANRKNKSADKYLEELGYEHMGSNKSA